VFESLFAHKIGKHIHYNRRLVINYIPINKSGVIQIIKRLTNRIRSISTVFCISGRKVVKYEIKLMVDLWKLRLSHLRSKPIGKDLFCPYIIEPFHSNIIAKPKMSCFVSDKRGSAKLFSKSRMFIEENTAVAVKSCSSMLHSSVLKTRNDNQIILSKRIVDSCIILHPFQIVKNLSCDV